MNKDETIAYVKEKLEDPEFWDYSVLAGMLRNIVPEEDTILRNLAYLLDHGEYGCSKGDVRGLLKFLEE
ncbi:MAG: hypothetical protein ACYSW3_27070 [Planctomycetota bacterium]|jgi:hypothetical protein